MRRQAGNIFFFLFGAVAVAGVLGVAIQNYVMGPLKTATMVNKRNAADTELQLSLRVMAMAAAANQPDGGDCDADGSIEPLPYEDATTIPHPAGGGVLPPTIGGSKRDPWGSDYGYCVWDHGTAVNDPLCGGASQLRLPGTNSDQWEVIAIISAGPDRVFQTDCNAWADVDADSEPDTPLVNKPAGSDDMYYAWTYQEASGAGAGLWSLEQADQDTAEITKNLSVKDASNAEQLTFDTAAKTLTVGAGGAGEFPTLKTDYLRNLTPANPSIESLDALSFAPEDGSGSSFYLRNPIGDAFQITPTADGSTSAITVGSNRRVAIGDTSQLFSTNSLLQIHQNTAGTISDAVYGMNIHNQNGGILDTYTGQRIYSSNGGTVDEFSSQNLTTFSFAGVIDEIIGSSIYTSTSGSQTKSIYGIQNETSGTSGVSNEAIIGIQNDVLTSGTNSFTTETIAGINNKVDIRRTANSASGINIENAVRNTTSVTTVKGLNISQTKPAGAGVITNRYGIYIAQTGTATNDWGIYQTGGQRNYLSGSLGINQTNPTVALSVSGDINYSGVITDTSDRRLKANIRPLEKSLDKLMMLDGYAFEMKDDPKKQTEYGVMAQDVQKMFPELVHTIDKDGHLGVTYDGLIPPIIEALKELKAENDELRQEIEDLKKAQDKEHPPL